MDEFSHLLSQAAALKTEQLAVDRRRFDSYPEWFQHTMFASARDRDMREEGTFAERLAYAEERKKEGNGLIAQGTAESLGAALLAYGSAAGMFRWLENCDGDWKKKVRSLLNNSFGPSTTYDC